MGIHVSGIFGLIILIADVWAIVKTLEQMQSANRLHQVHPGGRRGLPGQFQQELDPVPVQTPRRWVADENDHPTGGGVRWTISWPFPDCST